MIVAVVPRRRSGHADRPPEPFFSCRRLHLFLEHVVRALRGAPITLWLSSVHVPELILTFAGNLRGKAYRAPTDRHPRLVATVEHADWPRR